MGLVVYLPTWKPSKSTVHVAKYTIHGSVDGSEIPNNHLGCLKPVVNGINYLFLNWWGRLLDSTRCGRTLRHCPKTHWGKKAPCRQQQNQQDLERLSCTFFAQQVSFSTPSTSLYERHLQVFWDWQFYLVVTLLSWSSQTVPKADDEICAMDHTAPVTPEKHLTSYKRFRCASSGNALTHWKHGSSLCSPCSCFN